MLASAGLAVAIASNVHKNTIKPRHLLVRVATRIKPPSGADVLGEHT